MRWGSDMEKRGVFDCSQLPNGNHLWQLKQNSAKARHAFRWHLCSLNSDKYMPLRCGWTLLVHAGTGGQKKALQLQASFI